MRDIEVRPHDKFQGVYWVRIESDAHRLATRNLVKGKSVYGERLVRKKKIEYRLWDPYRSKLATAILKGAKYLPIEPNGRILYLGAGSGTTVSHVSDIVGETGCVYCVEFAPRVVRQLIDNVCAHRSNTFCILGDARFPDRYHSVAEEVDAIYCDIAQPEQARVLADNADIYLKQSGSAMLAIKSRSVNVTKSPSHIFKQETEILRRRGFCIHEVIRLEPFEKDHAMVTATRET